MASNDPTDARMYEAPLAIEGYGAAEDMMGD